MPRDHRHKPDPNKNAACFSGGARNIMIGMGGMMAGGFTVSISEWSPFPKSLLAGLVAAVIAVVIRLGTRPIARN